MVWASRPGCARSGRCPWAGLAPQLVGVLAGAALPGACAGRRSTRVRPGPRQLPVVAHLLALVIREALAHRIGNRVGLAVKPTKAELAVTPPIALYQDVLRSCHIGWCQSQQHSSTVQIPPSDWDFYQCAPRPCGDAPLGSELYRRGAMRSARGLLQWIR